MINLHQRFNHYLNTDKTINEQDVNEKLISYGWLDNGVDITGYYLLTENFELVYDMQENFKHKVPRRSYACLKTKG
jgi:hypothetical protein